MKNITIVLTFNRKKIIKILLVLFFIVLFIIFDKKIFPKLSYYAMIADLKRQNISISEHRIDSNYKINHKRNYFQKNYFLEA